jgi:hypothetical protein
MMVKLENILGISLSKNDIQPRISKRITTKTLRFGLVSDDEKPSPDFNKNATMGN